MNVATGILSGLPEPGSFESFALRCFLCSFLVLVGTKIVVWCLRWRSAALRHRVLLLGLAGLLVLPAVIPLFSGFSPTIQIATETESAFESVVSHTTIAQDDLQRKADYEIASGAATASRNETPIAWRTEPPIIVQPAGALTESLAAGGARAPNPDPAASEIALASPSLAQAAWRLPAERIRLETVLVAAWIAGALLLSLRVVAQQLWIQQVVRTGIPITDVRTRAVLESVNKCKVRVAMLCSKSTQVPVAVGIVRPAIVLPTGYGKWSADRLRVVLRHELTHVGRGDVLAQSVARFACVVYWFNPIVWQSARRMLLERELACDDAMLCSGENANDYADHLIEIAGAINNRWRVPHAASAMATHTNLQARVRHLLGRDLDRRLVSRRTSNLLTAIAISLVALLAIPLPTIATTAADDSPQVDGDESVTEFTLSGDIPRDWLERLKAMPNLRQLTIRRPSLKHFKVRQLKELRQLTSVRAIDFPLASRLADSVAVNISQLPNLQSVVFCRTGLSSFGLESLRGSPITVLELTEEELLTDDAFEHVAKMPSLRRLVVDATPIEVPGLKHLQACGPLRSFALRRHPAGSIRDGAPQRLAAIAGLGSLEQLEIGSTAYAQMVVLKKIKTLKQLTLRRCGALEASRSLKQLTQLDKLMLDNCAIRNETFGDVKAILAEVGIEVVDVTRSAGTDLLTRGESPVNEATRLARQVHREFDVAKQHPNFWMRWRTTSSDVPSMKAEPVRTIHRLKKALTEQHVVRPYGQEATMAWAPQQFYIAHQSSQDGVVGWEQIKYGNAKVGWIREQRPDKPPRHFIRNGISEFIDSLFYVPDQLKISQQSYWWGLGTHYRVATSPVPPERAAYTELAPDELAGEACRVLESAGRSERLWLGKESGRLRGHLSYVHQGYFVPFYKQDIVSQIAGRPITSHEEYRTLLGDGEDALPADKRLQLSQAWSEYKFDHAIPGQLKVFSDYQEIAPGRWFPFRVQSAGWSHHDQNQGLYDFFFSESVVIDVASDRDNLKLFWAAELPKEGESVQDQRFAAPVDYEYRADRTDDEIQELVNAQLFKYAESAMLIAKRSSPIKKMIGKPAPGLPPERWIGERPDVTGKRYLIHCWAAWCAPCKNDVPLLNAIAKNRIVIGIHPSGTDMAEIQKTVADAKMAYPTVVAPPGSKDIFGYPVTMFPYCIEVDEDGNVAKHGSLHEVAGLDNKNASTGKALPQASGVVLGTQPKSGLVAISLGEGDGMQEGQVLEVVRNGQRIARVRIVLVRKNRCIGKSIDQSDTPKVRPSDTARVPRESS